MPIHTIDVQRDGGISTVKVIGDKMPSITINKYKELANILIDEAENPQTGAVLLTGSDDKFLVGMDLSEIDKLNTEFSTRGVTGHIQDLLSKLESSPVPLISAINGLCFGGGLELVLCFHIVLATPSTKFSLPEIKLGTIPSYGGTQRLPRIIGRTRAFKLLLTGEIFSAELAHQWGLVTEIVSNDELLTTARHFAEMVSEFSRPAVASIIDCIVKGGDGSLRSGLSLESMESSKLAGGEDLLEGISAFFSKRKPSFPSTGKTKV